MLLLIFNATHNVWHPVFDLFLDALDTFLLFKGQIETCIKGISTTSVDFDELLILEELLFRNESGTDGEVTFGSLVVAGEIVTVEQTLAVMIPVPDEHLNTILTVGGSQYGSVEIR